VLIIEALVQLSALLAHDHGLELDISGVASARFKRQVSPGDQLLLETQMGPVAEGVGTFAVQAFVDGELAAEAQLLASFAPLAPGKR
jgi:3-hydroxyacyl-[acyl-carrier-protein] dehydratase